MIDALQNVHLQNMQVNILEGDFQVQENDTKTNAQNPNTKPSEVFQTRGDCTSMAFWSFDF